MSDLDQENSSDRSTIVPLYEHLELSHYVDTFRSSAERVRRLVFILTVFSLVMFFAQWNTTQDSWTALRFHKWISVYNSAKLLVTKDNTKAADDYVRDNLGQGFPTLENLKAHLDEYLKRRIDRIFFVDIPGLGTTFDINDLGIFSGTGYSLLLLLLLFSLMREHENLSLACFKVRCLHDRHEAMEDPTALNSEISVARGGQGANAALVRSRGESAANYLYHSLAMSQVLNSPPTLAHWHPSKLKIAVLHVIFLIPFIVQAYIVLVNQATQGIARAYGASPRIMLPQYLLLALNLLLGILSLRYSQACNRRWKGAFFYVNPELRLVDPPPWKYWIGWRDRRKADHIQRELWSEAFIRLEVPRPSFKIAAKPVTRICPSRRITFGDIEAVANELEAEAAAIARERYTNVEFMRVHVLTSVLDATFWTISACFEIKGTPRDSNRGS